MRLNKRERKAQQLIAHYATCERLVNYLNTGKWMSQPDGKKISVALFKLERIAHDAAEHYCSTPSIFYCKIGNVQWGFDFNANETDSDRFKECIKDALRNILGAVPPGFFVNSDPRGYALKIDNDEPAGKELIDACGLHKDWGGYGILSPEIDGN